MEWRVWDCSRALLIDKATRALLFLAAFCERFHSPFDTGCMLIKFIFSRWNIAFQERRNPFVVHPFGRECSPLPPVIRAHKKGINAPDRQFMHSRRTRSIVNVVNDPLGPRSTSFSLLSLVPANSQAKPACIPLGACGCISVSVPNLGTANPASNRFCFRCTISCPRPWCSPTGCSQSPNAIGETKVGAHVARLPPVR